jgi:hypothetical protein
VRAGKGLTLAMTAGLVTGPLVWLSLMPVLLVVVEVRPRSENGARVLSTTTLLRTDGSGPAFLDIRALLDDENVSAVDLALRPALEDHFYSQSSLSVSGRLALGTAQLGSSEWPLRRDEQFTYRLSANGSIVSEGEITTTVYRIAGSDPRVIAGIGILASLMQILGAVFPVFGPTKSEPGPTA